MKTYIGINAKSVKCIWEQHDESNTDISADVLPVLAEDASYKLWELANVSEAHFFLSQEFVRN